MPKYTVKVDFVPMDTADERTKEHLVEAAEAVEAALADHEPEASATSSRLVAAAKIEAEDEEAARQWGTSVLSEAVHNVLQDWRLESIDLWL